MGALGTRGYKGLSNQQYAINGFGFVVGYKHFLRNPRNLECVITILLISYKLLL